MRAFLLCLALLAALLAWADEPEINDTTWPVNSYRFRHNALACRLPSPDALHSCLHIGDLRVGMPWDRAKAKLGEPWKRQDLPDGGVREVHLVDRDAERRTFTYWVLDHRDGVLVSAQLTGNHAPADGAQAPEFSGLRLGDPQDRVRELLGPHFQAKTVPEVGAVLWDYAPFRFSIEFVDGRIYSLRVGG